ncbi:Peptidase C14 caspase catalytic subunit p20 [Nitrospira japonica]|uniref:Peptidase C14 caspase catalytic subunit p20 n=1 Tax=Nitrospira japonica TaxID=1325564 RepID=A0A1W1I4Y9_9BACT|nr:caspase family protein [Nitrospira japonica]SLM48074.1 Peptidase C14 caspase catalytic subunit p20 [Nitrospira japonica]
MTSRIAVIVGIDLYEHYKRLYGCVNDANSVKSVLERHDDGSLNFECKLLTGSSQTNPITKFQLRDSLSQLFMANVDYALFYFAGHGDITATDTYLLTSDSRRSDDGISLTEILQMANDAAKKIRSRNRAIVLDCCYSGSAGTPPVTGELALLSQGLTILTASTAEQYSTEQDGRGLFTSLFVDALTGSAASITGHITFGSIYAHVDQSLGKLGQRPVFKTNVHEFVPIRTVRAPIALADLKRIAEFFPSDEYPFPLNPSFEPEVKGRGPGMPPPDPRNTEKFRILQAYNRINLVVPVDAPHMWHAAMEYKSCKLTPLGMHYRRLVQNGRI